MFSLRRFLRALVFRHKPSESGTPSKPTTDCDFVYLFGWYRNPRGKLRSEMDKRAYKVRFFFNPKDTYLLKDCSFSCKFKENTDTNFPFQYCGFAYLDVNGDLSSLETWAKCFPAAYLYTYGYFEGNVWRVGQQMRDLKSEDENVQGNS